MWRLDVGRLSMSVQGSVEDLRRLRALGACSPSRWRRCDVMSGGWKHLVRAACQGGVVVLMSRYVRRLYVHLCVQPVKVASRCPDVTCTMLTNPLWVYFSLQSCRVSGGRVFSDFVMPGAACGPDGAGRARDTPRRGRSSVLASTQDRSRHHDSLTVKRNHERNLAVL
jgi:hypothetical protein